jgi:hypothetical protein
MKAKFLFCIAMVITFTVISGFGLRASERCDSIANTNDSVSKTVSTDIPLVLTPYHWNVIKFNPTPMLLFGETKNITFSYERLIRKNQSMSIQLGYLIIPVYFNDTIANLITLHDQSRSGINIGLDYRFYPSLRNRRPAPDGLYLGTYLSYYGFNHSNKFNTINQPSNPDGSIKGSLSMTNLGFELGYQFLFGKRFSIDLLMFGPSITYYSTKFEIIGNLDKGEIDDIDQEFADKLFEHFPALSYLFDGETTNLTNSKFQLTASFRYSIQFGFHF